MADFDYSFHDDPNYYGQGINYLDTSRRADGNMAHENECLVLSQEDLESSCMGSDVQDDDEEDDDDDEMMILQVSTLVVTCCVFVAVVLSMISQALGSSNKPALSRQELRGRPNSDL